MNQLITGPGGSSMPGAAGGATMNVDPSSLEDVTCDNCTNMTFQQVVLMKRMPSIISPTGKEAFVPMQVFACAACNHVNERFIKGMGGWFKGSKGEKTEIRTLDESAIEESELPGLELVSAEGTSESE